MSASVRISRKVAAKLLDLCLAFPEGHEDAAEQLSRGLRPSPKKTAYRAKVRKEKSSKRADKNAETARIREEVFARDRWCCVSCGTHGYSGNPLTLDHFWGRGKVAQAVENCWTLCASCHHSKTRNFPTSEAWVRMFLSHCLRHGYSAEVRRAENKLAALAAMGERT